MAARQGTFQHAGEDSPDMLSPRQANSISPGHSQSQDFSFDEDLSSPNILQDEPEDAGSAEEDNIRPAQSKRTRIARACDLCRKRKIKCDGKLPSCTHCESYKKECLYTHEVKKRSPPKGAKYIEGLENRLGRMESLLRMSGILSDGDDAQTDLGTVEKRLADRAATSPKQDQNNLQGLPSAQQNDIKLPGNATSQDPSSDKHPGGGSNIQEAAPSSTEQAKLLSDLMCSLLTNDTGETRYMGSSSGFSIFSPQGISWVNEKTGDTSFQQSVISKATEGRKWAQWPEGFDEVFERKVHRARPPKNEASSLVKDYFNNFNCIFPLFHEPTFMNLFEAEYNDRPAGGAGWWASFNAVLALSLRLRSMSIATRETDDETAWGYLKNCLAVQTDLTIRSTDLLSVQALLGMALFLSGSPNPHPSYFLIAAAIRLSHSIGLHNRSSGATLSVADREQRLRVFWIAYMLDRDISLRSGRPPVQDDNDMDVELPSEHPHDNFGVIPLADGKGTVNIFRYMVLFGLIQGKVYSQLYSVKSLKKTDGELLDTICRLDQELEEWKNQIPLDFRPEHPIQVSFTPIVLHIVSLHFAYYNCLTTIHRMSIRHGYWTDKLSNFTLSGLNARPLNHRVFSSAALCVTAARASINLIKYIPKGDLACAWLLIYYPVSALVTIFANILQNPQDARARSDVKLMNVVVSFLTLLAKAKSNNSARRLLEICTEFERIATVVLDRTDKEKRNPKRRAEQDLQQQPQTRQDRKLFNSNTLAPADTTADRIPLTPESLNQPTLNVSSVSPAMQTSPGQQFMIPDASLTSPQGGHLSTYSNPLLSETFDQLGATMNTGESADLASALDLTGSFQQPFVPQELWQMPMGLEWDLANMPMNFPFNVDDVLAGDQFPKADDGLS